MGRSGNPARRATQARVRRSLGSAGVGATRCRFYCDESGNTGVHWGDPDQPIFMHGGWLVPVRNTAKIADGVAQLRGRHRLNALELKWQQVARRAEPAAIFSDFYRLMVDHDCLPFFWVMDKDFITSAKAVETFFDPEYNQHFPMAFTSARDVKKELAEAVADSPEVRGAFARLMRAGERPTAREVRDLAEQLADHFQRGNAPWLAETLRDFSDDAVSQIQDELGAATWMRTTVGHSLPGLAQCLESFMRRRPVEMEIVHDNLVRHEPAFDQIRRMFRASDGTDFIDVGGEPLYYSMPTVTGLRLADSKTEPMLQQADLLCGFVRTVFTKVKRGEELTPSEAAIAFQLALARDELKTWDANMPRWMWEEFARVAMTGAPTGEA